MTVHAAGIHHRKWSGAWSFATAALTNGAHSLTATATDVAGNTSAASSALSVTIDTGARPPRAIASFWTDSGTVGDGITNDNILTLTGSAEANAAVKVYDGATLLGTATANGSGNWTFTTAALTNGAHSLTATATDVAGNTSAASSCAQRHHRHQRPRSPRRLPRSRPTAARLVTASPMTIP